MRVLLAMVLILWACTISAEVAYVRYFVSLFLLKIEDKKKIGLQSFSRKMTR
jgi:hypothetical protein